MRKRNIDTIVIGYGPLLNEYTMTDQYVDLIKKAAPGATLVIVKNQEEWDQRKEELGPRVEVVFGFRPATWFHEMPNLKWVQQTGAGANWLLDASEFVASDVILTNASGVTAIPIAEHILALMFTLSRLVHLNVRSQFDRKWVRRGRVREIDGGTMGLIGVGAIGEKTAEKAKGLNMRVLGIRRRPERSSPFVDQMLGPDRLHEILSLSDWVVITAAMTAETVGMIGEEEFKTMKDTAYIINIARGPIIQEKAMIKALQEHWIAGAGLDVFEKEPLPEESPLWDMKNVVITPHWAGATPKYFDRLVEIFTENLDRYQAGEQMINIVDKKLGY